MLSWHALGTRQVLVLHHTGCGLHVGDEGPFRARLAARAGTPPGEVALHTFGDPLEAVRSDLARIAGSPLAPDGLVVRGASYDLAAGTLAEVEPADH